MRESVEMPGIAVLVGALLFVGCRSSMRLPDPPPVDEQRNVAVNPAQADRIRTERYLAARADLIETYGHLAEGRWERAAGGLADQTRAFLGGGVSGGVVEALRTGEGGPSPDEIRSFDPVDFLVGGRPEKLGRPSGEDESRRASRHLIVLNESAGGAPRRVRMVKQHDRWVILATSWSNQ